MNAATQYRLAPQSPFTRRERESVTVLFGGLTQAHERLFKALLESRGFRVEILPTPTLADYRTGRRYANSGFCNPMYFTSGSLINFLRTKEETGESREELGKRFVYVTSRSAGPCRLGFYEQEYRNVLHNAGYPGFRVFAFSDTVALKASDGEEGFPFDVHFYTDLFSALLLGDVLNDVANRTRPYEKVPGQTDAAWNEATRFAEDCLRVRPRLNAWMQRRLPQWLRNPLEVTGRILTWPMDARLLRVLLHARRQFRNIGIDPFRVRPAVKLIGEFWAQTTVGDGNFRAHTFLERHGAEVVVEPVSTWMLYLLSEARQKLDQRKQLLRHTLKMNPSSLRRFVAGTLSAQAKAGMLRIGELMVRLKYNAIRLVFNGIPDPLPSVDVFERLSRAYYNPWIQGGESHMEVGKTLYYTRRKRAHMIVSLKPFGCLPSGMSDGVQPLVQAQHPETLYLSVETSGEGSTNAQSRMLMVLSTAREKALREFAEAQSRMQAPSLTQQQHLYHRKHFAHALVRIGSRGVFACRAASEFLALTK